jgi:gas vesicle protein
VLLDTLLGVLVGGAVSTVTTLLVQNRAARTIARSEIYVDLIGRAHINSVSDASSDSTYDAIVYIRRRAALLRHDEGKEVVEAELVLKTLRRLLAEERETGVRQSQETKSLIQEYERHLDTLERLIRRRLRWPS